MSYEELFFENYLVYFFRGFEFAVAAIRLEAIAKIGDENWIKEFKKHSSKPGKGFVQYTPTVEENVASLDRSCHRTAIYLFIVCLELLLKGVIYFNKIDFPYTHKITVLYEKTKHLLNSKDFLTKDLEYLFQKLDEVSIWFGRYPAPKKNNLYKNAINKICQVGKYPGSISNNIETLVDVSLLKK